MADELTLGEYLIGILPLLEDLETFPSWPPDCFALCMALLKRTGAYAQLLRDWPPAKDAPLAAWTATIGDLGEKWRQHWFPFEGLIDEWQIVCQSLELPLSDAREHGGLCEARMKLVATADEACEGVGDPIDPAASEYDPIRDLGSDFL